MNFFFCGFPQLVRLTFIMMSKCAWLNKIFIYFVYLRKGYVKKKKNPVTEFKVYIFCCIFFFYLYTSKISLNPFQLLKQIDRQIYRQIDRQIDIQTDRQIESFTLSKRNIHCRCNPISWRKRAYTHNYDLNALNRSQPFFSIEELHFTKYFG